MNDTPSAEDAPEFPGRPTAVRLGGALLIALFLVLVLTWRDNGRRTTLETTAEFTAVGDSNYYPMPATPPPEPYMPVASLRGQPLYPADYRRHEYAADDLARVGVDEKGGYIVYQAPEKAKNADERKRGIIYYLKISAKEYLKVRANNPAQ
jgi:hypothetical protein